MMKTKWWIKTKIKMMMGMGMEKMSMEMGMKLILKWMTKMSQDKVGRWKSGQKTFNMTKMKTMMIQIMIFRLFRGQYPIQGT